MSKYRDTLPQLGDRPFITDGGLETTLIYHQGHDLPAFASFDLMKDAKGRRALLRYIRPYLEMAQEYGIGIVLDTPTWRANRDWGEQIGYSPQELGAINRESVAQLEDLRSLFETTKSPVVISGCL